MQTMINKALAKFNQQNPEEDEQDINYHTYLVKNLTTSIETALQRYPQAAKSINVDTLVEAMEESTNNATYFDDVLYHKLEQQNVAVAA
jgi:hypothetical protein